MSRQEEIRNKGFDMYNTSREVGNEYGRIKVGVKTIDDAIIHLGNLNQSQNRNLGSKRFIFDAIERLKVKNDIYSKQLTDAWNRIEELDRLNETARNEAIKEFTERLVAEKYYTGNKIGYGTYAVMVDDINKIAEKMIGDNK